MINTNYCIGVDCMTQSKLLTVQEVADILKIKKNTVYDLIKRGDLPSKKVGKQIRISILDVEKYLDTPESVIENIKYITGIIEPPEQNSEKIVLCGQDISLDIIANYISAQPGLPSILRSHAGSYNSLYSLYQGKSHIATAHLWDEKTKEYNYPYITRLVPGIPVIVIRLFGRKQGLYVKKGNPKGILTWEDLKRDDLTVVNREKGSGTRVLLDEKIKVMKVNRNSIKGYNREFSSHLSVASAVARGEGDFGLGSEHGCLQVGGVEFIPLQSEWYDMVYSADMEESRPYKAIVDYITSQLFFQELSGIGCYDISQTGKIVRL
jgi:putative molybdopterin biosynthesis protein